MAVLVPEWSKGVDCKSIIREFESHPALKYGAVAQLGERLPCTEEVAGSNPVSSTLTRRVRHLSSVGRAADL